MGWAFVKRRMSAELGRRLAEEVRELRAPSGGRRLARAGASRARRSTAPSWPASCSIPTCSRRSKRTCSSCSCLFAIHRRMDPVIDTTEIAKEIGARMREELDYRREAKHVALYRAMLDGIAQIRVPRVWPELSTGRLLTLDWLEGRRAARAQGRRSRDPQPPRHRDVHGLVVAVQPLRRDPRRSASRQLHGVRRRRARPAGINLLDYGCIRIFPPRFVGGVVDLYNGLLQGRRRSRRARLRDLGLHAAQSAS